jgi:hypothetical protein
MREVKVRKTPDGWQSFLVADGKITVLDDFFMEEDRDTSQAAAMQ